VKKGAKKAETRKKEKITGVSAMSTILPRF
jgi:hypothetical protein